MTSTSRLVVLPVSALAAVFALAVVGCSGRVTPQTPDTSETAVNGSQPGSPSGALPVDPPAGGDAVCAGKACGVDCTPDGSDEPFSCNSLGKCVGTGPSLGCGSRAPAKSPECAGKACGVDCTPAGSDEPFNCNNAGACVATGQPLFCKVCPEFLADCRQGDAPADLDGDGCIDGCKPVGSK
jgi:hypothetical protein